MENSQIIEFVLQYPVFRIDSERWPALSLNFQGKTVSLLQPISSFLDTVKQEPFGSNIPQSPITKFIFHNTAEVSNDLLSPVELSKLLFRAISWLRITSRQFWLLAGAHGYAAQFYASDLSRVSGEDKRTNYAVYSGGVVVRPLSIDLWTELERLINSFDFPPIPDSFFCDALSSFAANDFIRALSLLGIAAEVEVSMLLNQVVEASVASRETREFLKRKEHKRDSFAWKFQNSSVSLGLQNPHDFQPWKTPSKWAKEVIDLYGLRSQIVHSGHCELVDHPVNIGNLPQALDVARFAFAVEALLQWSDNQREHIGISPIRYHWPNIDQRPIIQINAATLEAKASAKQ